MPWDASELSAGRGRPLMSSFKSLPPAGPERRQSQQSGQRANQNITPW